MASLSARRSCPCAQRPARARANETYDRGRDPSVAEAYTAMTFPFPLIDELRSASFPDGAEAASWPRTVQLDHRLRAPAAAFRTSLPTATPVPESIACPASCARWVRPSLVSSNLHMRLVSMPLVIVETVLPQLHGQPAPVHLPRLPAAVHAGCTRPFRIAPVDGAQQQPDVQARHQIQPANLFRVPRRAMRFAEPIEPGQVEHTIHGCIDRVTRPSRHVRDRPPIHVPCAPRSRFLIATHDKATGVTPAPVSASTSAPSTSRSPLRGGASTVPRPSRPPALGLKPSLKKHP